MSRGYIPQKPAPPAGAKKKAPEPKEGDNALWRVSEWFPDVSAKHMALLKSYHAELLKFNVRVNLISKNTEREADEQHFADSLLAIEIMRKQPLRKRIFDIGSGNGFPGLILAILEPKIELVLVESDARKSEFLKHVISTLKLKNATVMNARFESLKSQEIEVALSRGFASIAKTLLMCNKVFESGARFFHLKGNNWSSEIAELPSQLISVWQPELLGEYTLPVSQARRAIVVTQKR